MLTIQINGNSVETSPSTSGKQLASHHAAPLEEMPATNYLVIQTRGPVHSAEKTQLAANNIKIHEVVSPNTGVDVNSIVEQIAAEVGISPSDVQVLGSKLRVTVPQVNLASAAAIDQVKTINALPVF
ncbi:hypothetical protein S40288_10044 [Stachybotrys chartarum IBT 40288]|nr:hypothetical protein S40288_10044 [Stachybotrys chartarum IBT 40288]